MFKRLFGVKKHFYIVHYACGILEGHVEIMTATGKWGPMQTNDVVKEIGDKCGVDRKKVIIRNIIPMGQFRIKG